MVSVTLGLEPSWGRPIWISLYWRSVAYVTHDQDEALWMCDWIAVMHAGLSERGTHNRFELSMSPCPRAGTGKIPGHQLTVAGDVEGLEELSPQA